jgi:SnoaL-like domain
MKEDDEVLRELADREAIRDLQVRYCDYMWQKDVKGLLSLFTEDAVYVIKGVEVEAVSRGIASIKRMHEKALSKTTPRLFVHNQVVDLLGKDRATSRCAVEVHNQGLTIEWLGIGYFEDQYVKVDNRWKFSVRHHCIDGLENKLCLRTFMP